MSNAPCLGCTKRQLGCHETCGDYIDYQNSRKVYNYNVCKKRKEEKDVDDFRMRNAHKNKNK